MTLTPSDPVQGSAVFSAQRPMEWTPYKSGGGVVRMRLADGDPYWPFVELSWMMQPETDYVALFCLTGKVVGSGGEAELGLTRHAAGMTQGPLYFWPEGDDPCYSQPFSGLPAGEAPALATLQLTYQEYPTGDYAEVTVTSAQLISMPR